MTPGGIEAATYWADLWGTVEHWAFLAVVIALAVGFAALKFAEPHKQELEHHRASRIAELTTEAARLSKEAETAQAAIATANARVAAANRIAEGERLARLKLEKQLAPRSLSAEQQSDLKNSLAIFKGADLDVVLYSGGSADALPLAGMISEALQSSGWNVRVWDTTSPTRWVRGILVQTLSGSDQKIGDRAMALISEMRALGLEVEVYQPFVGFEAPESKITGPPWFADKVAPIRMLIGSKP